MTPETIKHLQGLNGEFDYAAAELDHARKRHANEEITGQALTDCTIMWSKCYDRLTRALFNFRAELVAAAALDTSGWQPQIGDLVWWPNTPFAYLKNRIGRISAVNFRGEPGRLEIDFGEVAMQGNGGTCVKPITKAETQQDNVVRVSLPPAPGSERS